MKRPARTEGGSVEQRGHSGYAPLLSLSFCPAFFIACPVALAASADFSAATSAPSLTFLPAFFAASFAACPASSIFFLTVSAISSLLISVWRERDTSGIVDPAAVRRE